MTPQKVALTVFFASVVINAILGIVALLSGEFDDTQGKILMTSLSISAATVLSLAMFPARERNLLGIVPNSGIALSVLGFSLLIFLVWTDWSEDDLGRTVGSILAFAFAAAYACLIVLARVEQRFVKFTYSAYVLVTLLAILAVTAIWSDPEGDLMGRIVGVVSILLAAVTVSVPVFHRINPDRTARSEFSQSDDTIFQRKSSRTPLACVICGAADIISGDDGTIGCNSCSASFKAEILN